jgi:hypothetical protein
MIEIVIPSHNRADRVKTLKLVPSAKLCVAESEYAEYRKYNPKAEIVTHPDSVVGLIPKRNWMVRNFGELFMLDDDLTEFKKNFVGKKEPCVIKDHVKILEAINGLHEMAKAIGVHLFGFGNKITPVQYNEFKPFSLRSCVTGRSYGVIGNVNTKWDESFTLKEDFLISCTVMYSEGMILTDDRYTFIQADTMKNPGGLSEFRNTLSERENCIRLRQFFGECVRLKRSGFNGQKRTKKLNSFNISVSFK